MENSLQKIYFSQLKELYTCEKLLVECFSDLIKKMENKELRLFISDHLEDTRRHLSRLVKLLDNRKVLVSKDQKCGLMEDLIREIQTVTSNPMTHESEVTIINLLQKVEHYEIASYSSVVMYSKMMELTDDCKQLQKTLDEEYEADNRLDKISEMMLDEMLKNI